jgi:CRISPR/Cas system-associated exonuclease Cas4 (RecB family)
MTFQHIPFQLPYEDLVSETTENGRTYITPEGNRLKSITTVLGATTQDGIEEWRKRVGDEEANRVSHHATTKGTAVHNICERYLNNEENYLGGECMPHVLFAWNTLKKVLDDKVNNILAQETPLYSNKLRVAGRVDLIAEYEKKPSIIDFKTSSRIKLKEDISNYFMQACAYSLMLQELTTIPVKNLVILMTVDNDPKPIVFQEKRESWIQPLVENINGYYENHFTE